MSIVTRLVIVLLFFITVPLSIGGFLVFVNAKQTIQRSALTRLEGSAKRTADEIERMIKERTSDISLVSRLKSIQDNFKLVDVSPDKRTTADYRMAKDSLDSELKPFQQSYGYDIMLANPSGRIVYATSQSFDAVVGRGPGEFEARAFEEGKKKRYVSSVFRNPENANQYLLLLTAPVNDSKNNLLGIIIFEIDMKIIYSLISDATDLGRTGEIILAQNLESSMLEEALYWDMIAILNPLKDASGPPLSKIIVLGEKLAAPLQEAVTGKNGSGISSDYRGKEIIAAWRHIPSLKWGMVAKIDTDEAFELSERLKKIFIAVGSISVFIAGIVALMAARFVGSPIRRLQIGVETIGRGDLNHKVGTDSNDEIGELSRAFDLMVDNLKRTTASRDDLDREVTARKKAEEELRSYASQLETANKELEAFSYSLAHDLRTPLRGIEGFGQVIIEDHGDKLDKEVTKHLNRIIAASRRMAALIDDILKLSRITRAEMTMETVSLSDKVRFVASELQKKQPERDVEFVVQDGILVRGDSKLLEVVIENLMDNAWKFTNRKPKGEIEFGVKKKEGREVYFIRDNGAGFDMTYQNKLFVAFQRLHTNDEFPGSGIGLVIVQRIISRHGGAIWAEGEVGKGAAFYFTLHDKKDKEGTHEYEKDTSG